MSSKMKEVQDINRVLHSLLEVTTEETFKSEGYYRALIILLQARAPNKRDSLYLETINMIMANDGIENAKFIVDPIRGERNYILIEVAPEPRVNVVQSNTSC